MTGKEQAKRYERKVQSVSQNVRGQLREKCDWGGGDRWQFRRIRSRMLREGRWKEWRHPWWVRSAHTPGTNRGEGIEKGVRRIPLCATQTKEDFPIRTQEDLHQRRHSARVVGELCEVGGAST